MIEQLQSERSLAKLSLDYRLPSRLRADKSVIHGLRSNPRIQCDMFEALVGGIWKQDGYAAARRWLRPVFKPLIEQVYEQLRDNHDNTGVAGDAVTKLHEFCQAKLLTPVFDFDTEGALTKKVFTCTITIRHLKVAGQGTNKQKAKQA